MKLVKTHPHCHGVMCKTSLLSFIKYLAVYRQVIQYLKTFIRLVLKQYSINYNYINVATNLGTISGFVIEYCFSIRLYSV